MCRHFQWGDEMPVDVYSQREPPVYKPRETEVDMTTTYGKQLQRPKL